MKHEKMVLVTGSTGFVGRHLMQRLRADHQCLPLAAIRSTSGLLDGFESIAVGDIDGNTDWQHALKNINVVVHAAARVHVMNDASSDPLASFRRVNVQGTLNLAQQAAVQGVKRFVFLSSVKVNGESTVFGLPYTERTAPAPQDAYGISKFEAEQGLLEIAKLTGMEVVIIRPPLIYGPGAKANFAALVRTVKKGIPLPLGAISNVRSFVGLDNLVDFVVTCISHPKAANETYMISDGENLSTSEFVRRIADGAGVKARLVAVPMWMLKAGASLLGKGEAIQRLSGNLEVDIAKAQFQLDWHAPVSVSEGLRRAIAG